MHYQLIIACCWEDWLEANVEAWPIKNDSLSTGHASITTSYVDSSGSVRQIVSPYQIRNF